MKKKNTITTLILILTLLMAVNPAAASDDRGTTDSQRIIDVESLQSRLDDATLPIKNRVEKTKVLEKFKAANETLKNKDVDKKELLANLKDLAEGISMFTSNYYEITDPLWDAQNALAETIEKMQVLLAKCGTGEPSKKVKKQLQNYDARLSSIAKSIKAEKNELRRQRLEMVFANVLSLRNLVERIGATPLGPAMENVYIKIISSLSNLELALTNATFQVEQTRIVLDGQSEFIATYCDILQGLVDAEDLLKVLEKLKANGTGGLLSLDLSELNQMNADFGENMAQLIEQITTNIDTQSSSMVDAPDIPDVDINESIERYSKMKVND